MLKSIISSFFTRAAIAVLNLIILLMSTRHLGSGIVGQVSLLILNIAIVQIINEIYTGSALVYYIPRSSIVKVYRSGLFWIVVSTACLNLIFVVFGIGLKELSLHCLLLSFTITLHSFHCVILLSKEKINQYNFLLLFQPLLFLLVLCFSLFFFELRTINSYLVALYVSYSCAALASFIFMLNILRNDIKNREDFSAFAILKNGFNNQLGNLAHMLSNRYNYYLISTAALVGVYASATSLIESIWIIGGSVAPILLTRVANTADISANHKITFLLSKLCFLLSLLCVAILFLLPEAFFTFLLGKDFTNTKSIMLHLSPGVLCISFSTVISHYFSGLGRQRVQLAANGLGLLTTVCLSYFLISRYQLIGACYAASLSYFVASLVLVIVFMKQNDYKFADLFNIRKDLGLLKK